MKLQRRRKLDSIVKDAYWLAVRDCLILLFSVSDPHATRLCLDRRSSVDLAPPHVRSNIFYHREPLDVATDLASSHLSGLPRPDSPSLDDPTTRATYEAILSKHGLF